MGYIYSTEKTVIFTDEGQRSFLAVRDFVQQQLKSAGAVMAGRAMAKSSLCSSWADMACVDRLEELGEIREVTDSTKCAWQHRVFVRGR